MREILFRGKECVRGGQNDGVEWKYGNLILFKNGAAIGSMNFPNEVGIRVVPDTIGQFIGKTDKNGKQIFEGDICRGTLCVCDEIHYPPQNFEVVYADQGFYFRDDANNDWHPYNLEDIEVIGNIHDNHGLLAAHP